MVINWTKSKKVRSSKSQQGKFLFSCFKNVEQNAAVLHIVKHCSSLNLLYRIALIVFLQRNQALESDLRSDSYKINSENQKNSVRQMKRTYPSCLRENCYTLLLANGNSCPAAVVAAAAVSCSGNCSGCSCWSKSTNCCFPAECLTTKTTAASGWTMRMMSRYCCWHRCRCRRRRYYYHSCWSLHCRRCTATWTRSSRRPR